MLIWSSSFYLKHTKHPSSASEDNADQDSDEDASSVKPPMISTNFADWCASYFAQSVMKVNSSTIAD